MEWINYHHLLYFWTVAREGGLVRAGKVLRLSHPTLSAQIHALEDQLGEKLFVKVGRKLELTEHGRVAFRYAEEIFSLGREMVDAVKGRTEGHLQRLDVGVVDVVPKLVVRSLLEPALALEEPVRLVCHEKPYDVLLAELSRHALDIVISDTPVPAGGNVRAFNHPLGETGVSILGTHALVAKYKRGFPRSLDGAPFLLPLETLHLRRSLNLWFDRHGIKPKVVAEFEDSALLTAFGASGAGLFPAPSVVVKEVVREHDVQALGVADEVKERFYAISSERRLKHPAVLAISNAARRELFA